MAQRYDGSCLSIKEALGYVSCRAICEGLEPRVVRLHPESYRLLLESLPHNPIDGRGYAETDVDLDTPSAWVGIPPVRLHAKADRTLPECTAIFDCGWEARLSG